MKRPNFDCFFYKLYICESLGGIKVPLPWGLIRIFLLQSVADMPESAIIIVFCKYIVIYFVIQGNCIIYCGFERISPAIRRVCRDNAIQLCTYSLYTMVEMNGGIYSRFYSCSQ